MESLEFEIEEDLLNTYPLLTPPVNLDERRILLETWCSEATQSHLGGWLADIAFGCEELGLLYEQASRFDEALELFSQALTIREPLYGTSHLLLCNGHLNISRILAMKGDADKADEVLKTASEMRHQIFGPKGEPIWQNRPQYNIVQDGESYVKLGLCLDNEEHDRRPVDRAGRLMQSAPASTPNTKTAPLASSPLTYSQADDIKCKKCGSGESPALLVLCDNCNSGFHIWCLPTPLDCVPADPTWVCYKCERRKRKKEKKAKRKRKKAKCEGEVDPAGGVNVAVKEVLGGDATNNEGHGTIVEGEPGRAEAGQGAKGGDTAGEPGLAEAGQGAAGCGDTAGEPERAEAGQGAVVGGDFAGEPERTEAGQRPAVDGNTTGEPGLAQARQDWAGGDSAVLAQGRGAGELAGATAAEAESDRQGEIDGDTTEEDTEEATPMDVEQTTADKKPDASIKAPLEGATIVSAQGDDAVRI